MKNNFQHIGNVEFPSYQGININMMPFIMGDKNSIPKEYHGYVPLIDACNIHEDELGKVGYLSITESLVSKDQSQRRGGIHTEKHPASSWGGGGWGGTKGGLYMASTVDNSCRVWDRFVAVPGAMGNCEHMRDELGEGTTMKAGELFWMNDSCPHESLPLKENTQRQWFRVVTSEVGLWYKQHSTANSLGIMPSCKIIEGSKF